MNVRGSYRPGLWLLVASGVVPAIRVLRRSRPSWLVAKLGLVLVLLLNTHLVVVPATGRALALASASAARGSLEAGYHAAYLVESLAGTANVLLLFGIAALAIWKPVRRRPAHAGPLRPAEPRLVR